MLLPLMCLSPGWQEIPLSLKTYPWSVTEAPISIMVLAQVFLQIPYSTFCIYAASRSDDAMAVLNGTHQMGAGGIVVTVMGLVLGVAFFAFMGLYTKRELDRMVEEEEAEAGPQPLHPRGSLPCAGVHVVPKCGQTCPDVSSDSGVRGFFHCLAEVSLVFEQALGLEQRLSDDLEEVAGEAELEGEGGGCETVPLRWPHPLTPPTHSLSSDNGQRPEVDAWRRTAGLTEWKFVRPGRCFITQNFRTSQGLLLIQ
jgi:hypothetical protein